MAHEGNILGLEYRKNSNRTVNDDIRSPFCLSLILCTHSTGSDEKRIAYEKSRLSFNLPILIEFCQYL